MSEIRISMIFEGGKLPKVIQEPTAAEIAAYAKTLRCLRPNQTLKLRRGRDGRSSALVITTADEVISIVG